MVSPVPPTPIAGELHHGAVGACDTLAAAGVELGDQRPPPGIAHGGGTSRGLHDVGAQHGDESTVDNTFCDTTGEERLRHGCHVVGPRDHHHVVVGG